MNIIGKIKSINKDHDIFKNIKPWNKDHIFPVSKGGTDCAENILMLSRESNNQKGDKTKGSINGIRFSVLKVTSKVNKQNDQSIFGIMYVKLDKNRDEWYEVING